MRSGGHAEVQGVAAVKAIAWDWQSSFALALFEVG